MYTRKNKKNTKKAISIIHKNDSNITGYIKFVNTKRGVKVIYDIKGMEDGLHGFHIHEYGDLHNGCDSAGSHFNPDKNLHSGRKNTHRHVGDLGNLLSKNNKACGYFYDKYISLDYNSKNCIIGRSIVLHENEDDLGKGHNNESKKTGNAGKRIACGVIGITN